MFSSFLELDFIPFHALFCWSTLALLGKRVPDTLCDHFAKTEAKQYDHSVEAIIQNITNELFCDKLNIAQFKLNSILIMPQNNIWLNFFGLD